MKLANQASKKSLTIICRHYNLYAGLNDKLWVQLNNKLLLVSTDNWASSTLSPYWIICKCFLGKVKNYFQSFISFQTTTLAYFFATGYLASIGNVE